MAAPTDLKDVAIIIPAFNEENRLGPFLERLIAYSAKTGGRYDILVVDDGSTDGTRALAEGFKRRYEPITVLSLPQNQGKGEAVRRGMLHTRKSIRAFMDADGSFGPEELEVNLGWIRDGDDVVAPNRFVPESVTDYREGVSRKIMRWIFNTLVRCFLFRGIGDSQCGFKIFRGEVAHRLFSRTKLKGFGLDLEVLYLARRHHCRIRSVPVRYDHREGTRVRVLRDSIRLFMNIFQIRFWDASGRYA